MAEYEFKTTEPDLDPLTRTVVKTVPVAATTSKEEFTLEQKESNLRQLNNQGVELKKQIEEQTAEITEVKTALGVK